jgi:hypothetical protein
MMSDRNEGPNEGGRFSVPSQNQPGERMATTATTATRGVFAIDRPRGLQRPKRGAEESLEHTST